MLMLSPSALQVSLYTLVPRNWCHCRLPLPLCPLSPSVVGLVSAPAAWMKCCTVARSPGRLPCCSARQAVGKRCSAFIFWLLERARESEDYTSVSMSPLSGSSGKLIILGLASAATSAAG